MNRNQSRKVRPVMPLEPEVPLDFNPSERLHEALRSRPAESGITIDPRGTRIIDDGLWIRSLSTGWVVKTSIADVPSMVPENSAMEQVARVRREDKELGRRKLQRMFPETFLDRYVSLHEGKERPAITFRIELDKDFSVRKYRIFRSAFTSTKQCDYQPLRAQLNSSADAGSFKEIARGLFNARVKNLIQEADAKISGNAPTPRLYVDASRDESLAETLIHEVMLLTNTVAGDFFKSKNQAVPTKIRGIHIHETSVTNSFEFDQVCNRRCWQVANYLDQRTDYSRLTSPMRNFRDYVTMKALGRLLSGQPVDQALQKDISGCSESFNLAVKGDSSGRTAESAMTSPRWRDSWGILFSEQRHGHPFGRALACPDETITGKLDDVCRQHAWQRPIVAERTIIFQGTHLYFAGMNFHPPKGLDIQTWAVARDPDAALETASYRMLEVLKPMAPLLVTAPGRAGPV